MDSETRLRLEQKKLHEMRHRIVEEECLGVMEVAKHYGVSRSTVESWPYEVLPWINTRPGAAKRLLRYHPADVIAAGSRLAAWERAIQKGEGKAYLEKLAAQLEQRFEQAERMADEMARQVWAAA